MSTLATQQAGFLRAMDAAREGPLALYRDSVAANHREALAAAYPVVARLVGEAFFAEAARAYARLHPSASGDLHRFGERFAGFLAAYPHAASLAYLPDVARLEWALHRAAFAADPPRGVHAPDPRDWEQAVLAWHPSAATLASPFAILSLWEANQPARDGTPDAALDTPCRLLAWRDPAQRVRVRPLDAGEAAFIAASLAGAPLAQAVEHWRGSAEALQALLAKLRAEGALLGVR